MPVPVPAPALWAAVLGALVFGGACSRREAPPGERAPAASAPDPRVAAPAAAAPLPEPTSVPHDLGPVPAPADNPGSEPKLALGSRLFFDARLSADGKQSCYSCHRNEDGTGGHDPIAVGANGVSVGTHAPVLWNVAYLPALFWDGRARTLEAVATQVWAGANMGVGEAGLGAKARAIGGWPEYRALFVAAFPGVGATPETVAQALATFVRTLRCSETAFDRFARGDRSALTDPQRRGLGLFMGKAVCTACHTPPHFTSAVAVAEGTYFNVGVGLFGQPSGAASSGRRAVTGRDEDAGAHKPPTLRNVPRSAPYFHDGSVPTLDAAVRTMAEGGTPNPHRSPLLEDRGLTAAERADLVAFLGALDCGRITIPPGVVEEEKTP